MKKHVWWLFAEGSGRKEHGTKMREQGGCVENKRDILFLFRHKKSKDRRTSKMRPYQSQVWDKMSPGGTLFRWLDKIHRACNVVSKIQNPREWIVNRVLCVAWAYKVLTGVIFKAIHWRSKLWFYDKCMTKLFRTELSSWLSALHSCSFILKELSLILINLHVVCSNRQNESASVVLLAYNF